MRTLFFLLFAAASLIAVDQPNIVLIFADDLGINDLACYGRKDHRTPNLDKLAEQGMRFTCAYAAQPICSPSRAALMTGKHPARLHLTNYLPGRPDAPTQKLLQPRIEGQLPLEEVTIAELLRGAGYATGLFGKWHLGGDGFGPKAQGFDTVVTPPAQTATTAEEGGKGEYAITRAAEQFIEANKDRPFFCYVPHNNPHIGLRAKPELIEKNAGAFNPTYAAMIETLDDTVGLLMKKIESLGLAERTIFIFTSDNGGLHVLESPDSPATHNTPFRAGKGYLYEGGLREPLIVRWPGKIGAGKVTETPVLLTDLVPTLLEFAGIDPMKTVGPLDGVSIAKVLRGESVPARPMFWHFPNYTNQGGRPASAIRDGEWKLIEHLEDDRSELYNLAKDPSEQTDVAEKEKERVAALKAKLHAWRERVGAQMPRPNPNFDAKGHEVIYVQQDSSRLTPDARFDETAAKWKGWRTAIGAAAKGRKPRVTPGKGVITLPAIAAAVHGAKLRYESEPYKNTLGFWVNKDDWAEWSVPVPAAGNYEVDILQGCGNGSGGAEVEFTVGEQKFTVKVVETGHFQHFIRRSLGEVKLPAGMVNVIVKPITKPGAAVMDLREVRLIPLEEKAE
jgi:arylsulfatase A